MKRIKLKIKKEEIISQIPEQKKVFKPETKNGSLGENIKKNIDNNNDNNGIYNNIENNNNNINNV